MKKSTKLRRKTRRLIIKNLIVFAVLIAVASVGVRSWLSEGNNTSSASGIQVVCEVPDGVEVAIVSPGQTPNASTVWHEFAFTLDAEHYPFIQNLHMAAITGDGKSFLSPPIKQQGSVAMVDTAAEFQANEVQVNPNQEYLSFDMYFRTTKQNKRIFLDDSSIFQPTDADQQAPTLDFGNAIAGWSSNSVIGAARMCIYDTSHASSSTRSDWQKLLWIPAPFLHFEGFSNANKRYEMNTNVSETDNTLGVQYYNEYDNLENYNTIGTYNHGYYYLSSNTWTRGQVNLNSNPCAGVTADTQKNYKLNKDVDLLTFPTETNAVYNNKNYRQGFVRVNCWIEGEDSESRALQVDGKFSVVLSLGIAGVTS